MNEDEVLVKEFLIESYENLGQLESDLVALEKTHPRQIYFLKYSVHYIRSKDRAHFLD